VGAPLLGALKVMKVRLAGPASLIGAQLDKLDRTHLPRILRYG
jgi:hypothetical protein